MVLAPFNIGHRYLTKVPFNSELNTTHFKFKICELHAKLLGHPPATPKG